MIFDNGIKSDGNHVGKKEFRENETQTVQEKVKLTKMRIKNKKKIFILYILCYFSAEHFEF